MLIASSDWADDAIFSTPSSRQPTEERPPNTLCTPQPTPAKRKRPHTVQTSATKKARLEAIEAGLRARQENEPSPQSSRHHPEQADQLPFTHENQADTKPRPRYSFLGLSPTQESEHPSTHPSIDGKQELFGLHSSSALLTPPQSMRPEPVTPTRHKGKEPADPEWDDDEVRHLLNPRHRRPMPCLARMTSLTHCQRHSRTPSTTPRRALLPVTLPQVHPPPRRPANAS